MSTISYLDRFLDPMTDAFTPQVAQAIIDLRADSEIMARVDGLRRKANEGTLSPEEDAEYKEFVEAVDIISVIQAKARQYLARHQG